MKCLPVLFFCLILFLFACVKEEGVDIEQTDVVVNRTYPNVDRALWTHFEAFEIAARNRGLSIDLDELGIIGVIENIDQDGVAGHCRYGSHIDNEVTIDSGFWSNANAMTREFVVFHELGHCVLFRGHDETVLSNGACESIMRSGLENCRDRYNQSTRETYLNELFSENNS